MRVLLSFAAAALLGLALSAPARAQHSVGHTPARGHYDYTPGHHDRHRLHYDYTPGHYDSHRGGHFPGPAAYPGGGYYPPGTTYPAPYAQPGYAPAPYTQPGYVPAPHRGY